MSSLFKILLKKCSQNTQFSFYTFFSLLELRLYKDLIYVCYYNYTERKTGGYYMIPILDSKRQYAKIGAEVEKAVCEVWKPYY